MKIDCNFGMKFQYFFYFELGVPMVPVSWTEMQCPDTLAKEFRKVAKIVPESAVQEAANNKTTS